MQKLVLSSFLTLALPLLCAAEQGLWLEAERFRELGGWVMDQQSMETMGSAYVMAHGLGVPVADAATACVIPRAGTWTVWVRTRDWTAPWKRGTPAGRFNVLVNGTVLSGVLGTNGNDWNWQKAGEITLPQGNVQIALRDLTGFNGRCDALYLTDTPHVTPPGETGELAEFRRQHSGAAIKDDPIMYDLAIAGGGMAGTCAAVAALHTGSRVVLIQDRPVLGGCNSSEVRVGLGGWAQWAP